MCQILDISRSSFYYQSKPRPDETSLEARIREIFKDSRKSYGTRKIKAQLALEGIIVSRRKIGKIMKKFGLISVYRKKSFKPEHSRTNRAPIENVLDRQFNDRQPLEVVVTDLTYVRVGKVWHYCCVILDLFNREMIGFSAGAHKTAELVQEALQRIPYASSRIQLFHTDRGSEFDNALIDNFLEVNQIQRSLSKAGTPRDNAVAESTYHCFKTEFVAQNDFQTLEALQIQLADYVHWWNHFRLHSSLNYQTPARVRENDQS